MKPFVAVCLAMSVACSRSEQRTAIDTPAAPPAPPATHVAPPIAAPPIATSAADPSVARPLAPAHNDFGIDLWKQLSRDHAGNLALSPASLSVALAMTVAGARGATKEELLRLLRLADVADRDAAAAALVRLWGAADAPYALRVANRLFGEATTPFEPAFVDLVASIFAAPLERVDFRGAFERARLRINDWVAARTEDRIEDLLPPQSIDALTRLVLVNAIYFKGQWKARFDPARTSDGTFQAPAGGVRVPFMHAGGAYDYGRAAGASVLQLPYVGDDLAMTIVLPDGDLAALEATLSAATLDAWVGALRPVAHVEAALPRFRVATDSMMLKPALEALGMKLAFTPDADFGGITPEPVFIKDAIHKVFVEVNEEGTEAAAATAVIMARETASRPIAFVADKPFLFFVRDLRTGHVIFMGRVVDPA